MIVRFWNHVRGEWWNGDGRTPQWCRDDGSVAWEAL